MGRSCLRSEKNLKMSIKKTKIIVILGPTASGKTKLAVKLARDYNGEIISADSRQIYKYMNLGTGKDLPDYKIGHKTIPYHLIDVVGPKTSYNLAKWLKIAQKTIQDIESRGKLPIICGGTGLYISALCEGYDLINQDPKKLKIIRNKLNKKSLSSQLKILKTKDPDTYKTIDQKNPRRVQRTLENILLSGQALNQQKNIQPYNTLKIGIKLDKKILHQKIETRMNSRFEKGMLKEIALLRKKGVSWKKLQEFGLEYKWMALYSQKQITLLELKTGLANDIKKFAKRQMTWFKRDTHIQWINKYHEAKKLAKTFLK